MLTCLRVCQRAGRACQHGDVQIHYKSMLSSCHARHDKMPKTMSACQVANKRSVCCNLELVSRTVNNNYVPGVRSAYGLHSWSVGCAGVRWRAGDICDAHAPAASCKAVTQPPLFLNRANFHVLKFANYLPTTRKAFSSRHREEGGRSDCACLPCAPGRRCSCSLPVAAPT